MIRMLTLNMLISLGFGIALVPSDRIYSQEEVFHVNSFRREESLDLVANIKLSVYQIKQMLTFGSLL